jgi:hypothetical protein
MHEPSWEALTLRVDRLEAENRCWKRLASATLLLASLLVVFGATAGKRVQSPTELRGQRLALVDKAARVRAELTMSSDNQPSLILMDGAGKPRLTLALAKYSEPLLSLTDAGGTRRIVLSLDLYGGMLRLADDTGNPRAALVVPAKGDPDLELLGKDDKPLWRAP